MKISYMRFIKLVVKGNMVYNKIKILWKHPGIIKDFRRVENVEESSEILQMKQKHFKLR